MYEPWSNYVTILVGVLFIYVNLDLGVSISDPLDSSERLSDEDKMEHATRLTKEQQNDIINNALREYNKKWCENCTNRFDIFMLFKFTDQILVHGTLRRIYLEIGETYCPKEVDAPDCQFKSGFGWNKHMMCIFEVNEDHNATVDYSKGFQPKCLPKTPRLLRMFIDVAHMIHAEMF